MILIRSLIILLMFQLLITFQANSETLEELRAIVDSTQDFDKVDALNELGKQLVQLSPSECIELTEQSIAICDRIAYPGGKALSYYISGKAYTKMGYYEKAAENSQTALSLARDNNDFRRVFLSLIHLGSIYSDIGEYARAKQYYGQALSVSKNQSDERGIAIYYNNDGTNYFDTGDSEKALEFYQKTFDICLRNNFERGLCLSKLNLGQVFLRTGDLDKADKYLSEAYQCCLSNNYNNYIIYCLKSLGMLACERKDHNKANSYFEEALHLAEKNDFKKVLCEIYEEMSECASKTKNFEKALEYHKTSVVIKDSLNEAKTALLLTEAKHQYDRGKLNAEGLIQNDDENNSSYLLYALLGILTALVIVCFLIRRKTEIKARTKSDNDPPKAISSSASELAKPAAKQKSGGGTSDHVVPMSKAEREENLTTVRKSADRSHELLSNLIEWTGSKKENFPFNPNIVDIDIVIKNNLKLFNLNFQKKNLKLFTDIADNTFAKVDHYMLTTIIRNLISNAVKYTPENGEIKIQTTITDDLVKISVSDNGIGISEADLKGIFEYGKRAVRPGDDDEKGAGLGLVVCKQFVEKHSGDIQAYSKEGKGSEFVFTIPVK
ncbi:MAG: tetratricopeptide repeat protein [Candidatus Kapabacteria bacterium]|jgi:tetratricopeptide (TPR) repeat protein|nr:tetratricopeptide repeat protein [Candidatus Kapabacteria bacterium]